MLMMESMRAPRDRDAITRRIHASRTADAAGPRRWDVTHEIAVPAAAASPAEIRAMTFAAALGPDRAPFSTAPTPATTTVDLAGEEALLAYLATQPQRPIERLTRAPARRTAFSGPAGSAGTVARSCLPSDRGEPR